MTLIGMVGDTGQTLSVDNELISYLPDTHNHILSLLWATMSIMMIISIDMTESMIEAVAPGYLPDILLWEIFCEF
jgi:hypothetical protein